MSQPEDPIFCQTCKQPLNPFDRNGVTYFKHREELRGGSTDHRAVPVALSQLQDAAGVCDFCDRPDPAYIYTCAPDVSDVHRVTAKYVSHNDFLRRSHAARVIRQDTEVQMTHQWGENWSACTGCAALIETASIEQLITRVTDVLPAKLTRSSKLAQTRALLRDRYSYFFATLQPGRLRITRKSPLGEPDLGGPAGLME